MSRNINQLPVTSAPQNLDKLYLGRSPYGLTDDFAILWQDLQAAVTSNKIYQEVKVVNNTNLAGLYNNGIAGVGATLTNNGVQVALVIDGITMNIGDRVLLPQQATFAEGGIYEVTDPGSGVTNWVLTRTTDFDTPAKIQEGGLIPVVRGDDFAGSIYVQLTQPAVIGVDPIAAYSMIDIAILKFGFLQKDENLLDVQSAPTAFLNISPTTTEGDIIIRKTLVNDRLPIGAHQAIARVNTAVAGKIQWDATILNTDVNNNFYSGQVIPGGLIGSNNLVQGLTAGNALTSANSNTIIGVSAGSVPTTGGSNVIIGKSADTNAVSDAEAVIIGASAIGGNRAVAIGSGVNVANIQGIAIGRNLSISADECVIVGNSVSGVADRTVVFGDKNLSANNPSGVTNMIFGHSNVQFGAGGFFNTIIGSFNAGTLSGGRNFIAGNNNFTVATSATDSVVIGGDTATSITTQSQNVFIGSQANQFLAASNAVSMGYNADAATDAVGIGHSCLATGLRSVAIGKGSTASGFNDIAIGQGISATGTASCAMGFTSSSAGPNSIAIGNNAITTAPANSGIAIGSSASASATNALGVGVFATASAGFAVAVGNSSTASGLRGVAIGNNANAVVDAVAIGSSTLTTTDSISIGNSASTVAAINTIAIGKSALVTSAGSICIGANTTDFGANDVIIGAPTVNGSFIVNGRSINTAAMIDTFKGVVGCNGTGNFNKTNVGANDTVLTADSATSSGMKWASLASLSPTIYTGNGSVPIATARTVSIPATSSVAFVGSASANQVKVTDTDLNITTSNNKLNIQGALDVLSIGHDGVSGTFVIQRSGVGTQQIKVMPTSTGIAIMELGGASSTSGRISTSNNVPITISSGSNLSTGTINFETAAGLTFNLGAVKGSLFVANGTGFIPLGVGTNGQVLSADSAEATGVKWIAAPSPATIVSPNVTTAGRLALTPVTGQQVFDTDLNQFFGWNGTAWVILG